jgi:hypothetical protein
MLSGVNVGINLAAMRGNVDSSEDIRKKRTSDGDKDAKATKGPSESQKLGQEANRAFEEQMRAQVLKGGPAAG